MSEYNDFERNVCIGVLEYKLLDLELFMNFELLRQKELFIWGAASKGIQIKKTLTRIGIGVSAFCDSDIKKWGELCEGIPVISPYNFTNRLKKNPQACVISCIFSEKDLLKLFQEIGIKNVSLISYWGVKFALYLNEIALEVHEKMPIYDEIWSYRKRQQFKTCSYLLDFLSKLQFCDSDIIWIWQPGKVASKTLLESLSNVNISAIHTHSLNYPTHVFGTFLHDLWSSKIEKNFSKNIKIITGVREPLARDYSAFWQAFDYERLHLMPILNKDFQKLYESFIDLILSGYEHTCELLQESNEWVWNDEFEWFNREIKKCFGIDVYRYPFDKEQGYGIIENNNIQIFIYKTEKLDDLSPMLSEFLGKKIQIKNTHQTYNKQYYLINKDFRKKLKLPRKYVEHYYKSNPYLDHFYTKLEQKKYLSQWEKCIVD